MGLIAVAAGEGAPGGVRPFLNADVDGPANQRGHRVLLSGHFNFKGKLLPVRADQRQHGRALLISGDSIALGIRHLRGIAVPIAREGQRKRAAFPGRQGQLTGQLLRSNAKGQQAQNSQQTNQTFHRLSSVFSSASSIMRATPMTSVTGTLNTRPWP